VYREVPGGFAIVCSAIRPDVPPSPTRRSSDLWERLTEGVRDVYLARARAAVEAVVPIFDAAVAAIPGLGEVRRAQLRLGLPPEGDRKSTRLNSSHVKISYAVFCLKKKRATSIY